MDSPLTEAGNGADPRAELSASGDERRIEELLRVNARLAAEVRSLALGRTDAPRSGSMVSSRKLAALVEDRDALAERLQCCEGELAAKKSLCGELEAHRRALDAEVIRLRGGWQGILRRFRARLLGR